MNNFQKIPNLTPLDWALQCRKRTFLNLKQSHMFTISMVMTGYSFVRTLIQHFNECLQIVPGPLVSQ